jgi:glucose 1-dehydrogenase
MSQTISAAETRRDAMPGLKGKNVLVTGGSSGIGQAIAVRFAEYGANVAINYLRQPEEARETEEQVRACVHKVRQEGVQDVLVGGDVSDEADIVRMVGEAAEALGGIDVLVNNAGIQISRPSAELSSADFDRVIAVNLRGTFLGLRSAFRQYAAQGSGGAMVVTGSICSLRGSDDLVPYHASKHAVLGLMRSAAVHGAERGIRVNGIAPGVVLTDLVAGSPEGAADATRRAHIAPQRRPGTTAEVADLISFLLSDNAGFLTGEMISIDGGATAMNPVRHSGQRVADAI